LIARLSLLLASFCVLACRCRALAARECSHMFALVEHFGLFAFRQDFAFANQAFLVLSIHYP
jgi:hypothetical protein